MRKNLSISWNESSYNKSHFESLLFNIKYRKIIENLSFLDLRALMSLVGNLFDGSTTSSSSGNVWISGSKYWSQNRISFHKHEWLCSNRREERWTNILSSLKETMCMHLPAVILFYGEYTRFLLKIVK